MHAPITLSGKKCMLNKVYVLNKVHALNKQVSKYVVMPFSNNTSILSFVLTGYEFMLSWMCFMHLALLDYSTPAGLCKARPECCMVLKSHV